MTLARPLLQARCLLRTRLLSSLAREEEVRPLIELTNTRLAYPGSPDEHGPWNLSIYGPTGGGHAVLGRQGTGKSLLSSTLVNTEDHLRDGLMNTDESWHKRSIAHVSFESHEALLRQGGTASKAISDGGQLSKAAQFLVVRFGLYPLLHRDVATLSTGEIRKVLIIRALAGRPRLLILDNAFDGLDVESRSTLSEIVAKTIQGFRPDILVQAVSSAATAHTQVLLMTHRVEEILDQISTITTWNEQGELVTLERNGRSGAELFQLAMGLDESTHLTGKPWNDASLPSVEEIQSVWADKHRTAHNGPLIEASDLAIRRGDATILSDLDWTVKQGQSWLIAGGNGTGKSTLSRLLAKDEGGAEGSLAVKANGLTKDCRRRGVGWVSTELHIASARSSSTVRQILQGEDASPAVVDAVASWLEIDGLFAKPFAHLSQGQQKLVLIGAAFASRPDIVVLDEPCQGLDLVNRHRVLGLMERVLQATDTSLIYITHHLEELLPSVENVLHLKDGKAVYSGHRKGYDPSSL